MSLRKLSQEELSRFAIGSIPETLPAPGQSGPGQIPVTGNVEPFMVPQTYTVRQAMERLEKTAEKVIFVVDAELRLVGSLTDGDIRRWILSDGDLKAQVFRVCNRNPYVAEEGFDAEQVRADMLNRNLGCVPVVNRSREILRLLFWKELFQGGAAVERKRSLSLPVVIMAGGGDTARAFYQCSSQAAYPHW